MGNEAPLNVYGVNAQLNNPDIPTDFDPDTIGNNFQIVQRSSEPEQTVVIEEPEPDALSEQEVIRNQKLAEVLNSFDIPEEIIAKSKQRIAENYNTFLDYIMCDVIPLQQGVLSALESIPTAMSRVIDNDLLEASDVDVDVGTVDVFLGKLVSNLIRQKIIDMSGMNVQDVKQVDTVFTHQAIHTRP
jgi:hypothetical protein